MRIGPYEVVSTLGKGGVGVVYAARSPEGRDVAVKVLRKSQGEDLARFEREARLLASFTEDDGFVPLLDSGATPQGPFLVMPLIQGGTLRAKLGNGPLPLRETVELGRALARALGNAHARGVVHRDVKPENVLFGANGRPLLADLGLAKHFRTDVSGASQSVVLSRGDGLRGTAGYMPPEQMRDARTAGPPADVFALGAVIFECLTGEPAFKGETVIDLIGRVDHGTRASVADLRPGSPPWLTAVIDRSLALVPEERFADGAALARALEAGEANRSRRPRAALAAVLVLGGLVAAVALASRFSSRDERPVPTANQASDKGPRASSGSAAAARAIELLARGEYERALDAAKGLPGGNDADVDAVVLAANARLTKELRAAPELPIRLDDPKAFESAVRVYRTAIGAARVARALRQEDPPAQLVGLARFVVPYWRRQRVVDGGSLARERETIEAVEISLGSEPRGEECHSLDRELAYACSGFEDLPRAELLSCARRTVARFPAEPLLHYILGRSLKQAAARVSLPEAEAYRAEALHELEGAFAKLPESQPSERFWCGIELAVVLGELGRYADGAALCESIQASRNEDPSAVQNGRFDICHARLLVGARHIPEAAAVLRAALERRAASPPTEVLLRRALELTQSCLSNGPISEAERGTLGAELGDLAR